MAASHKNRWQQTVTLRRGRAGLSQAMLVAFALASGAASSGEEVLRNWFNDPYFQVRDGVPTCPVPLGPFSTEAEMRYEGHHRAERGTRCWLAKQCSKPNSYLYDPEIATAVRLRFESTKVLRDANLWVTIQGRVVRIEGCVPSTYSDGTLERLLRTVPDVERVIVTVIRKHGAKPPYRTLAPGQRRAEA